MHNGKKLILSKLKPFSVSHLCGYSESVKFPLQSYKTYRLETGPASEATCTRDEAVAMYEMMQKIRRMETTCGNLYKEKAIRGFCHLSNGQEAVAVGIESSLEKQDTIITSYRCHGFTMTRGASIHQVIAELMGKSTGSTKGKGGSMHMYGRNFYGGNGIVGAQVPLGAGLALAHKYNKDDGVCVTLYGDGAANQGQVFEAFNIASLWNLPCIFVCENNHFGMGTAAQRSSANPHYYTRGDYVPGLWVDAMDVLTVREAVRFAREWCVTGKGPILLEMDTYRYYGHSMSDPGVSYRTREEVQSIRQNKDPITKFSGAVVEAGLVTDAEIKKIDKDVKKEVEEAVNKARKDSEPEDKEAFTHIYSNNIEQGVRGVHSMSWIKT